MFSSRLREGKIIHKKSLRAPFTSIFYSEATQTSINVFPFHFKCQRSNLFVLGMKTRPWKFVNLARKAPAYCISWTGPDWTGLVKSGLVKRGLVKRGLAKRGLVKRGLVKRGLVKRGLVKRGLVKRGLVKMK